MKPQSPALRSLFMIFAAILLLQCTKESTIPKKDIHSNTPGTAGSIIDLGVVSGETRHMSLTLTGVSTMLNGTADNPEETSSNINLVLYTDTDGIINDGIYVYSESPEPEPFTFTSASVYMSLGDQDAISAFFMNGGAISVTREGTSYKVSFDGTLASGHTISGSFEGRLSYEDAQ